MGDGALSCAFFIGKMDEQDIINNAFYLLEKDNDVWETTDSEYLAARGFLNIGVVRWENYDNTTWRELWTTLADAADGDKSVSAATYDYNCPTNFVREGGYVTTTDATTSVVTYFKVLPPEEVKKYESTTSNWCYFTGNKADGFDLHFNPSCTLSTDATIDYPYYKSATQSSSASDVLEVSDPNYLSYFIASHMSESSESMDSDFFTVAEGLLRQMKSRNNSGVWGVPFNIEPSLEDYDGFGMGGGGFATSDNPTGR